MPAIAIRFAGDNAGYSRTIENSAKNVTRLLQVLSAKAVRFESHVNYNEVSDGCHALAFQA
jgi:hypothetical protein